MSSLKELQDLIQEKYGAEMAALDPHDSMREKGFDSLALVEFVFAIEEWIFSRRRISPLMIPVTVLTTWPMRSHFPRCWRKNISQLRQLLAGSKRKACGARCRAAPC